MSFYNFLKLLSCHHKEEPKSKLHIACTAVSVTPPRAHNHWLRTRSHQWLQDCGELRPRPARALPAGLADTYRGAATVQPRPRPPERRGHTQPAPRGPQNCTFITFLRERWGGGARKDSEQHVLKVQKSSIVSIIRGKEKELQNTFERQIISLLSLIDFRSLGISHGAPQTFHAKGQFLISNLTLTKTLMTKQ